ncbi:unnamed protein product, partial [Symbiodinium microadriaticum]
MQSLPSPPLCNPGSSGHPFLCARRCVYVMKRGWCHVQSCKYCHLDHYQPVVKLNKRQRHLLQRLDRKSKIDLLLAAFRRGLQRAGLTDQAGSFISLLEDEASMQPEAEAPLNKRRIDDLLKALKRMTLNDNITAFEDVLPEQVIQSFQDLRRSLAPTCDAPMTMSSK